MKVNELAAFLRSRRETLTPEAVGLSAGSRRHVRGLRREEVAQLAGIGVSWYTLLEQGRVTTVSEKTLEGIARALQLTPTERSHLFALGSATSEDAIAAGAEPAATLLTFVRHFIGGPAFFVTAYSDAVAWNDEADEIFGFSALPPDERNMLLCMLRSDRLRTIFPNREHTLRNMVAVFRVNYARIGGSAFDALIERLKTESTEFAELWSEQLVEPIRDEICQMNHPRLGAISMQLLAFAPFEDIRYTLITLTPVAV